MGRRSSAGTTPRRRSALVKTVDVKGLNRNENHLANELKPNTVQDEGFALFEEPISGWWSNDWIVDQENTRLDDP